MSHFFLDSSALVKRYSPERGSAWVKSLTDPASGHIIIVAEISLAEVAAALAAKHRAPQGLSREELTDATADFLGHCNSEYQLVPVARLIIERAVSLTQHHRLRGYDAVQLGAALVTNQVLTDAALAALTCVTADDDLLHAARAEGLSSENPNMHP